MYLICGIPHPVKVPDVRGKIRAQLSCLIANVCLFLFSFMVPLLRKVAFFLIEYTWESHVKKEKKRANPVFFYSRLFCRYAGASHAGPSGTNLPRYCLEIDLLPWNSVPQISSFQRDINTKKERNNSEGRRRSWWAANFVRRTLLLQEY